MATITRRSFMPTNTEILRKKGHLNTSKKDDKEIVTTVFNTCSSEGRGGERTRKRKKTGV